MKYITIFLILLGAVFGAKAESITDQIGKNPITEEQARLEMARLLNSDTRVQEAISQYRRLLAIDPTLYTAQIELAQILAAQNQLAEAKALLQAVPADKLGTQGKLIIASIAETEGNFKIAQEIYEQILNEESSNQAIRFRLAEVFAWQKNYTAAINEYRKLVKARPNDTQLLRHFAQVLGWAKQYKEAILVWEQAIPK